MDGDGGIVEALAETTVFLSYFKDLPDHRQAGKVTYPLDEILLLSLLAVLAGAETFVDMARFGEKKLDLLRPFRDGTPAHDHLGDIFATLDTQAFQRCFVAWVAALTETPVEVIAIDGKTLRRSYGELWRGCRTAGQLSRMATTASHRPADLRRATRLLCRDGGGSYRIGDRPAIKRRAGSAALSLASRE